MGISPWLRVAPSVSALPRRRQLSGFAFAIVLIPALTVVLLPHRRAASVGTVLLLYLTIVVITAAVGGILPAIPAVLGALAVVNWYFTPPYHRLTIADGEHVLALVIFLLVATIVAVFVTTAEQRALAAADARAEADALDRTNELRTALLTAVSHDLRTPLASIKASVSSLRASDVTWSPEEAAEFLAVIEEDTDRLNQLVGNLLDMSRIQTGTLPLVRRPVALEEVVANALRTLPPAAVTRLDVDVPETLPLVSADPGLLERAIANLVANAVAWSPRGSPVTVAARPVPPDVELCVIDHGPGIAEHQRDLVFQPFQRLGDRTRGGVGLGLAVARGFVDAMGGEIHVGDTPGGGTTMRLVMPAVLP